MAVGRGLEPKSLGGVLITPAGCCGEAKLEAGAQGFDGPRQPRDLPRRVALLPAKGLFTEIPLVLRYTPPLVARL